MANSISVTGAAPFRIEAHSFMIQASGQGYTLKFSPVYSESADDYTAWEAPVPSGVHMPVINCPRSCWWILVGNEDTLTIAY